MLRAVAESRGDSARQFVGRFDRVAVINSVDRRTKPSTQRPAAVTEFDSSWVEAVALRVIQLMRDGATQDGGRLIDAAALATELGVDRSWVYQHRDELGAVRLGAGARPRLRFDIDAVRQRLEQENSATQKRPEGREAKYDTNRRSSRRRPVQPETGSILVSRPRKPA